MSKLSNVLFLLPENDISTRCTVDPGLPYIPFHMISPTNQVSFKNKNLSDPTNIVSASLLTVSGNSYPITGSFSNGTVLTANSGSVSFASPSATASSLIVSGTEYPITGAATSGNVLSMGSSSVSFVSPTASSLKISGTTYPITGTAVDGTVLTANSGSLAFTSLPSTASSLIVNSATYPITGTAVDKSVLSINSGTLSFAVPGSYIKYVSALAPAGGNGTIGNPYTTITQAIDALALVTTMKYIFILPGSYSENIRLYPNTALIGSGLATTQLGGSIGYNIAATTNAGSVYFKDISVEQVALNTTSSSGITAAFYFQNVVATGPISMVSTQSNTTSMAVDNFVGTDISFNGNSFNIKRTNLSGTMNMTFFNNSSATQTIINLGQFVGGNTVPQLTLQECQMQSSIFLGSITLLRDPSSITAANYPFPGTVTADNFTKQQGLPIQFSDNSMILGIGTTTSNLNNLVNCVSIGTLSNIPGSSTNRTAIGYGATTTSNNQFAIGDTVTKMKASGLTGHSASTAMTYDAPTGLISFLSSNRDKKDNIDDLSIDLSGQLIDSISPKKYIWKENGSHAQGMIAEDISDIVDSLIEEYPCTLDLIAKDDSGKPVAINYLMFIPHMLNTIKDLRKRLATIEEQLP